MINRIFRPIPAIALAALIAGAITILPGASEPVVASSPLDSGKTERIDLRPLHPKCTQQAWPYIEADCLRDHRVGVGQAKPVRIVTTDRIGVR
ncbi:MAG: hypothetical protein FJX62_14705 [Alphaproteobacteria bacterium]|nr:hypothetical protein [Alphaproteobacteria bacterium]